MLNPISTSFSTVSLVSVRKFFLPTMRFLTSLFCRTGQSNLPHKAIKEAVSHLQQAFKHASAAVDILVNAKLQNLQSLVYACYRAANANDFLQTLYGTHFPGMV